MHGAIRNHEWSVVGCRACGRELLQDSPLNLTDQITRKADLRRVRVASEGVKQICAGGELRDKELVVLVGTASHDHCYHDRSSPNQHSVATQRSGMTCVASVSHRVETR